jgi:large subunit ribosomal protein L35
MEPNISLNCQTTRLNIPVSNYIPPHPQQGTPYHRYTLLLFQNPGGKKIDCDVEGYLSQRDKFNVRQFSSDHSFNLNKGGGGGGVFMWREVWNETVSDIYEHTLSESFPPFVYRKVLIVK